MQKNKRNTAMKVLANLDNPLKSYDFSKFLLNPCVGLLSWQLLLVVCDVRNLQLSIGTVHKFHQKRFLHKKNTISPCLLFKYVRAKMLELGQLLN